MNARPNIQSQRARMSSTKSGEVDLDVMNTIPDTNTQHHYKDIEHVVIGKGLNDSSHLKTERDLVESMNNRQLENKERARGQDLADNGLSDSSGLSDRINRYISNRTGTLIDKYNSANEYYNAFDSAAFNH